MSDVNEWPYYSNVWYGKKYTPEGAQFCGDKSC